MKNTAQSYAEALFELSREEKAEKEILNDLSFVSSIFKENGEYLKLLNSYAVTKDEKDKMINDAFGSGLNKYSLNFLKLLSAKNILHLFFDCEKEFARLYRKSNNIECATVVSVIDLSEAQKEKCIEKLENMSHRKIIASFVTDPSILGGIIVRFENSQLDMSVKSRLEDMKKQIFS